MAAKHLVQKKVQDILQQGSQPSQSQVNNWIVEHVKELIDKRPDLVDEITRRAANDIERQIGEEGRTGFIDVTSGKPKSKK